MEYVVAVSGYASPVHPERAYNGVHSVLVVVQYVEPYRSILHVVLIPVLENDLVGVACFDTRLRELAVEISPFAQYLSDDTVVVTGEVGEISSILQSIDGGLLVPSRWGRFPKCYAVPCLRSVTVVEDLCDVLHVGPDLFHWMMSGIHMHLLIDEVGPVDLPCYVTSTMYPFQHMPIE